MGDVEVEVVPEGETLSMAYLSLISIWIVICRVYNNCLKVFNGLDLEMYNDVDYDESYK